jgi:regulator of replication initiation timing
MARPEKYTESDYLAWVESQVINGRSVKDIKAAELQKAVGGKYSRCQEVLAQAQDRFIEQQSDSVPPMPVWFRDFVTRLSEQARAAAEGEWSKVGRGINESIKDATVIFEDRQADYESRLSEQLDQIRTLEANADDQAAQIEELKTQLSSALSEVSDLKSANAGLKSEVSSWKQQKADFDVQLSTARGDLKEAERALAEARSERDILKGKVQAYESPKK